MTISSGGLIQASDYNTLRTTVSDILGTTGTTTVGYGQVIESDTTVAAGDLISARTTTLKQWVSLYNDMKKIADHQGTNISALTTAYTDNIKSGSLIQYSDINLISTTLTTLYNNRLNVANGYFSIESLTSSTRSTQWGAPSKTTVQHSFTVTFASYNAARYFFNTGGAIQFTASRSGGSVTSQNTDWTNMLSNIGTVVFNYNGTSASSGTGSAYGFYQLGASALQIYTKGGNAGAGAVYANNDYTITASIAGAVITFNVYFNDDAKNSNSIWGTFDFVDGTLTSTVQIKRATVAGGVTVTAPSAVNTTLLSS